MESVGKRIIEEINRQRRTIKDVAEDSGLNPDSLSKITRGLINPRRNTVQRIASALGVETAALMPLDSYSPSGDGVRPGSSRNDQIRILTEALLVLNALEPQGITEPEDIKRITEIISLLADQE